MAFDPTKPSFSPRRRWAVALQVGLTTLLVLFVLSMVNFLSRNCVRSGGKRGYFMHMHWSTRNKIFLSSRTQNLLGSLTNRIKIILYYDKDEPLYKTVADLVNEYSALNSGITVQAVD